MVWRLEQVCRGRGGVLECLGGFFKSFGGVLRRRGAFLGRLGGWSQSRLRDVLEFRNVRIFQATWKRLGGVLETSWNFFGRFFRGLENVLETISHWLFIFKACEASLGADLY